MQKKNIIFKLGLFICLCTICFSTQTFATENNKLLPTLKVDVYANDNNNEQITMNLIPNVEEDNLVVSDYMEERNTEIELLKKLYPYLGIINATKQQSLNIYIEKDTNSAKVGTTNGKTPCIILDDTDENWYQIRTQNIIGYIEKNNVITNDEPYVALYSNELVLENNQAIVTKKSIYTKETPNGKNYKIIKRNQKFEITNEVEDWCQIKLEDNTLAYVKKEDIKIEKGMLSILNNDNYVYAEQIYQIRNSWLDNNYKCVEYTETEIEEQRNELVNYSLQFDGNPYVWGGTDLVNGADCSGFTQSIYKHYGIQLPRTALDQSEIGIEIQEEDLMLGDLVFYSRDSLPIGHVAIYIGNGQIIHARNTQLGIMQTPMDYSTPVKFVRILG